MTMVRQQYNPTFPANVGVNLDGVLIDPTLIEAASGTHARFTSIHIAALSITGGGAALTVAAGLYIAGPPTGATTNYSIFVDDGNVQFDGNLVVGGTLTIDGATTQTGVLTVSNIAGALTIDASGLTVNGGVTIVDSGLTVSDGSSTMTDNAAATTTVLALVNATATQSSVLGLTIAMDDGANGVDGDTVYLEFIMDDDAQVQIGFAQIHGVAVDTANGNIDGGIRMRGVLGGSMTTVAEFSHSTSGVFQWAFATATPAVRENYTTTSQSARDADTATTVGPLQDVVQTLIADLIAHGVFT